MKSLARLASLGLLSFSCLAAFPSCKVSSSSDNGDDGQLAEDAAALTSGGSQSTGLGQVLLSPVEAADSKAADAAAQAVETRPISGLLPEGCATKTRTGEKVHVEFKSCTGPFGLVRVNGGIDVTFSMTAAGGLHAELSSVKGLTLQDRPVEYSATVDLAVSGTKRELTWNGSWSTETLTGAPLEYTSEGDLTVDLATLCVTFSGEASGSVGGRGLDITIDDLAACPTKCPSGTVTATGKASGLSVSVEFDGSKNAEVTGPKGHTFKVPLVCSAE